jgi:hypothetical protein
MYGFDTFVKNQKAVAAWAYFGIFYSTPLVYMSVFISCCFYSYDFIEQLEVRYCDTPTIAVEKSILTVSIIKFPELRDVSEKICIVQHMKERNFCVYLRSKK